MTNRVGIFFFSGTGNTRLVAGLLEQALSERGCDVATTPIEDTLRSRGYLASLSCDTLGIGFPVHGFGAPRLVLDFVRRLPRGEGRRAFLFLTAADVVSLNRAATATVARRLTKKGYDIFHESLFPMPANFAIRYPGSLAKRLCTTAEREARRAAEEIVAGERKRFAEGTAIRFAARAANLFERSGSRALGLAASRACRGCSRCVETCPTQNIALRRGRARFGWRCLACFRCVYACPEKAIAPRLWPFLVLAEGYDIERVAAAPELEDGFFAREPGVLYRRLVTYVQER